MARYVCSICGYVYDESKEGAVWSSLSAGWTCPVCGAERAQFQRDQDDQAVADAAGSADDRSGTRSSGTGFAAVTGHRVFGYVFLAIYVLLMVQMVPRLWNYQIEFPARTVVHISLGMAIGAALLLKIAIVRFFRRLEQSLVPQLGTCLLVGSIVLIGISVPAAFKEAAATAQLFNEEEFPITRRLNMHNVLSRPVSLFPRLP